MNIRTLIEDIKKDELRNDDYLHLTANEAQMSQTARLFLGSKLSERYYFSGSENDIVDFGIFTALGIKSVENIVDAAEEVAKEMLHAYSVNLNLLSGVHAMMCSILSTTQPGDTVMTVSHEDGGHFATPGILERIGRKNIHATFDHKTLIFDSKKIAEDFHASGAKEFYMDVSYYLNPHNLEELRDSLGSNALIVYDASHTIGLIMGQTFQAPLLEGANVISANTHKTLPGPQKGLIAFRDKDLADEANAIINGSLYSSPHTHGMIALSIAILEMKEFGQAYSKAVIHNSNVVGKAFEDLGYELRKSNSGSFSDNHQVHIFIDNLGDRMDLYKKLVENNISTNFDDPLGERLYIRFGTQEITRRGMGEPEMKEIASLIHRAFNGEVVKDEVIALNRRFPKILYSFDEQLGL